MKLIPNAKQAYKFRSVQVMGVISALAVADFTVLEGKVPAWAYAALGLLGIAARVVLQSIADSRPPEQDAIEQSDDE